MINSLLNNFWGVFRLVDSHPGTHYINNESVHIFNCPIDKKFIIYFISGSHEIIAHLDGGLEREAMVGIIEI